MSKATLVGVVFFIAVATGIMTAPEGARADNRNVTFGFILQPVNRPLNCSDLRPVACSDPSVMVTGELDTEYYALLCAFGGDPDPIGGGIAGMEFGITYDDAANSGVDILEWRLCADLEFGREDAWPASGTGNLVTWAADLTGEGGVDNCQREVPGDPTDGVTAIAGFFFLTASDPDRLSITPRPVNGMLTVASCKAAETALDPLTQAGSAAFTDGDEKGKLPCIKRVEEDTTWGFIKSTYNNN